MESASQYLSVALGTILSGWNQLSRRVLLLGRPQSEARFVSLSERCWSSDLLWSLPFYKGVQISKRGGQHNHPIKWKGVTNMKDPFSLAAYPLLLSELRPATIIELGAMYGGSACWLADMMEIQNIDGRVYSFEIQMDRIEGRHPKVEFHYVDVYKLEGFDANWLESLPHPWLVIEDAHFNVYNVLQFFAKMMHQGDYLVVEDTLHYKKYLEVKRFIEDQNDAFLADTHYTDLFGYNVTWHPNSFFRRM